MKKKKFVSFVCSALLVGTILTACSSNQSPTGTGTNPGKTVGFMQLANENKERIWFEVDDSNDDGEISKDDTIMYAYKIKNGKADTFNLGDSLEDNLTLSDIKNMKDEEILSVLKDYEKKYYDHAINYFIGILKPNIEGTEREINVYGDPNGTLKYALDLLNQQLLSLNNLSFNDALKLQSDYPLVATVETDSSGNQVIGEEIFFKTYDFDLFYENGAATKYVFKEVKTDGELQYSITGKIYDQTYKGYYLDNSFLVTSSLDNSVNLIFDTLDTKNVTEE